MASIGKIASQAEPGFTADCGKRAAPITVCISLKFVGMSRSNDHNWAKVAGDNNREWVASDGSGASLSKRNNMSKYRSLAAISSAGEKSGLREGASLNVANFHIICAPSDMPKSSSVCSDGSISRRLEGADTDAFTNVDTPVAEPPSAKAIELKNNRTCWCDP